MGRVFAQEDGNLEVVPITATREKTYKDVDLTFTPRTSGDIFKKNDAAAVKQSIKNLLMTNRGEKPFDNYFGGDLNSYLFENMIDIDGIELKDKIAHAINNYEPRAYLKGVQIKALPDNYKLDVLVQFQVISTMEVVDLNLELTRLR